MLTGLSFKGIHSKDIGVTVKTLNRPIAPAAKQFEVSSPCMDGSYDFSAANELGRVMYKDRIFEIEVSYTAADIHGLQRKNRAIAAWLMGKGALIFDDSPDVYWLAKASHQIDYAPLCLGRAAVLKVYFRAEPFAYGVTAVSASYTLESGSNAVAVNNPGTWYTRPVFTFTSGINLGLSKTPFALSVSGGFDSLTVDCGKQIVTGGGAGREESGIYLELAPGDNDLRVTVSRITTMTVRFVPRYI